jgi:hypothetical protein
MKGQIIIGLFLNALLLACGESKRTETTSSKDSIIQEVDSVSVAKVDNDLAQLNQIAIDTFSSVPSGCSCYFSSNQNEFKARKYIYADDYGSNAFISIGGDKIKFALVKSDTAKEGHSVEIFKSEKYEMIIEKRQVGESDETWQQEGTLTIKSDAKVIYKKYIYGECGC